MRVFLQHRHNLIPVMDWEVHVQRVSGLTLDQTRFAVSFLACIYAGVLIRLLRSPAARNAYAFVVGALLLYYPFGSGILHTVFTSWLTYLVMWLVPRKCGTLAWLINFPYLLALHAVNASGLSWNAGVLDPTGAQMVLTLKLISTAMCLQDSYEKKKEDMTSYQREHHLTRLPSPLEFFGYVFCFGNLLSGPIIEYKDYSDFISHRGVWDPSAPRKVPLKGGMLQGVRATVTALLSAALYLTQEKVWSFHVFATNWYHSLNLLGKMCVIQVVGTVYRSRYYFAWSTGWASLAFAGFDFLKWEERTVKARDGGQEKRTVAVWGRGCNSRPLKVEFCDSGRMLAAHWNTTTGNFLRRYVYERLTPPNGKPTFFTLVGTQLVSALWHGLYPGYFMFFVGSAFLFAHSTVTYNWEKGAKSELARRLVRSPPYWALKVFITKECLDFLAAAFLILTWRESIQVWASVHYIPLIWMVSVLLVGQVQASAKKGKRRPARDATPASAPAGTAALGAGAPGAAFAGAGADADGDALEPESSGVIEALAQGLQDAETAPRLDGDADAGGLASLDGDSAPGAAGGRFAALKEE